MSLPQFVAALWAGYNEPYLFLTSTVAGRVRSGVRMAQKLGDGSITAVDGADGTPIVVIVEWYTGAHAIPFQEQ